MVASAIDATLNPEKSDYLYFIADENGVVRYSTDEAGHNQNIDDYGLVKDEDAEETTEGTTQEEASQAETAQE